MNFGISQGLNINIFHYDDYIFFVKNIQVSPWLLPKYHEFQVCNKKLSHYICSNLMKFIVIYG